MSFDVAMQSNSPYLSNVAAGMMNLGRWQLTPAQRLAWIEQAVELGVTTFDHADIYGDYTAEALFGEALALKPALRERLQLIGKCGIRLVSPNRPQHRIKSYDTTRAHIIASAEASLRNLQTDYLDILLIHRPDPLLAADDVAAAFEALHQAGKVRSFGVSNFTPSQFDLLQARLNFPLVTNQVQASVVYLEPFLDGTFDQCQRLRIRPMAWSPVGGGRFLQANDPQGLRLQSALQQIADEWGGLTLDQAAVAWLATHPGRIIPVMGTGKLERLQAAVAAAQITLTREQWFSVWEASTGYPVP